ncbi:uncharacterized protein LOC130773191 [Actinidia eriantha]|uniref:uncharacterized protein LOC130773191 n=1 Tax=Actinidia eriantha TaxID=165200 RepID=UPI0025846CAF|nr:uncharacterized protein LOC130773191 [Actinidia eriantha]
METPAANPTGAATTASSNLAKLLNSPSQAQVQPSISVFRRYCELDGDSSTRISGILQFEEEKTFKQVFQMMDRDLSFKNLVEAISTNEAVWKAVFSMNEVQNFLHSNNSRLKTGANSRAKAGNKRGTPEYNNFRYGQQYPPERNEQKDSEPGIWKTIVSFLSRVWKTIWMAIKIEVFEYIQNEEKKSQVEGAFAIALVVRLCIALLTLFHFKF